MNAAVAAIEADERRVARDSYRDAGGSQRRPLKSFMTAREKREARDAHAALIHLAVAELRDPAGFERWIEALELNPQLTAMNGALAALQTPGEIVGTAVQWSKQGYRIGTGERAAGRLTARGFWPLAYFTAEQANAGDLAGYEPSMPGPDELAVLCRELAERLDRGDGERVSLEAVAEKRNAVPLALAA